MERIRGFSLVEALVVVAIAGMILAIGAPELFGVRRKVNLERLARHVKQDAMVAKISALTEGRNVGLVFSEDRGRWYWVMVADGNGNGVSRRDYLAGVDRAIGPRVWLEFLAAGAGCGVPEAWAVPDPSGSGLLPADGLRAGRSNIISFTPRGTATPSSVYFHDGHSRMLVIRVHGGLGRIRVLEWRRGWPEWKEVQF